MSERRSRAVLFVSLAILFAAALIVLAVDWLVLRSGEPLCIGHRCLMVTKHGDYVTAELHGPVPYGKGSLLTYTSPGFERSDLDTDADGTVDCREECTNYAHYASPCVSRRVGNDWLYEPAGIVSCDAPRDQNFWPDAGF